MTNFIEHVENYLRLRRALGFKLKFAGHVLPQFVAYLDAAGAATLTADLAIAWAGLPRDAQPISLAHRLGVVRGFATYLQTMVPATEVPPAGIWSTTAPRPVPFLYSDADVRRLLDACRQFEPGLRAVTYEALIGLLAVSGMRIGEALGLQCADVDLGNGVLTIREAKFGRSRLVPLHSTTTSALDTYAGERDRLCPKPRPSTFFVSHLGRALPYQEVQASFRQLTVVTGLCTATVRPRLHDLRHSFAVRTLIDWHRAGGDVHDRIAVLSTFLGHVNPAGTFWYLSGAPELMELAAARLSSHFGGQS